MMKEVKDEITKWVPKLDDKIKALNSSRVFKKVTPKGDLSWYVKWVSSIIIIFFGRHIQDYIKFAIIVCMKKFGKFH